MGTSHKQTNRKEKVNIVAATTPMQLLLNDLPQVGKVDWLGVRPAQKEAMVEPDSVELRTDIGIVGDRYVGRSGKRQVTLIQSEHLLAIAAFLGREEIEPSLLRRNIMIRGLNLLALKNKAFTLGSARLEFTGLCHPCSAMQQQFGSGGYNAVRGHGGITARVLLSGIVRLGDTLQAD